MVNYSGNVCSPIVMPAPNPRFHIAALEVGDALLEVTWQNGVQRGQLKTSYSQLPRRPG
jgi:hypothetical protein